MYAHLKAIEALQKAGDGINVNLRILLDPQEEIGSPMLEYFVTSHADLFKVDYGYNADGPAADGNVPIISLGKRGSCYLEVNFKAAKRDAHSGQYGGPLPNGAWRLVEFRGTLRNANGRVGIDGFYNRVAPPTALDRAAMDAMPFDRKAWLREMGIEEEAGPSDLAHFEKIMFQPTLNICVNHRSLSIISALRTILKRWNRSTMSALPSSMAFSGSM